MRLVIILPMTLKLWAMTTSKRLFIVHRTFFLCTIFIKKIRRSLVLFCWVTDALVLEFWIGRKEVSKFPTSARVYDRPFRFTFQYYIWWPLDSSYGGQVPYPHMFSSSGGVWSWHSVVLNGFPTDWAPKHDLVCTNYISFRSGIWCSWSVIKYSDNQ